MSKLQLTKTRLVEGVWHGVLTLPDTAGSQPPAISVTINAWPWRVLTLWKTAPTTIGRCGCRSPRS